MTDKLRSYRAADRELMPATIHDQPTQLARRRRGSERCNEEDAPAPGEGESKLAN